MRSKGWGYDPRPLLCPRDEGSYRLPPLRVVLSVTIPDRVPVVSDIRPPGWRPPQRPHPSWFLRYFDPGLPGPSSRVRLVSFRQNCSRPRLPCGVVPRWGRPSVGYPEVQRFRRSQKHKSLNPLGVPLPSQETWSEPSSDLPLLLPVPPSFPGSRCVRSLSSTWVGPVPPDDSHRKDLLTSTVPLDRNGSPS